MPRKDPVGEIHSLADQVKDVTVVFSIRLWDFGQNELLWFHPSAVIYIPPGYRNINTTIQAPNGEGVWFNVSQSVGFLEVENGWLGSGIRPIFYVSPETFLKRSGHLS